MHTERLASALQDLGSGKIAIPDPGDIFVGDGNYLTISAEFLAYFANQGGLKPDGTVLDVGCGIGRMAAGLACYLDPERGRYVGFDPVPEGIAWCRKAYGENFPHFSFHWVDLFNPLYRPEGQIHVADFDFPIADASIDLAILTSIFTHLDRGDIESYLKQLARVTKPQGRIFATAYLFEGAAPERLAKHPHLDFSLPDPGDATQWHVAGYPPLAAVAFQQSAFVDLVATATGRVPEIHAGRWRGGAGPWFQDLVLA